MRDAIEEVLLLQTDYTASNTPEMQRRGQLVRTDLAGEMRDLLPTISAHSHIDDLQVQGKDGLGQKTEIPWTRIYSKSRSPNATEGWYLVLLFSAGGDRAYLSLNQGTTRWDGVDFRPQPRSELVARTHWARGVLSALPSFPASWTADMHLDNRRSGLGTGYELGNVAAAEYPFDDVPTDDDIEADLLLGSEWLAHLYAAADLGLYVPGDSPEVADAAYELTRIASPNRQGLRGRRLTAAERKVIELRAEDVVFEHFDSMHYAIERVGATRSYDLHAVKGDDTVLIEVKGTTSDGSEIILTRNEVDLHRKEHPSNALAIVRHITLHRSSDGPSATGGELVLEHPWVIDETRLEPIAYRYSTQLP